MTHVKKVTQADRDTRKTQGSDTEKEMRVRMAPSPTGFIHVGTLRTVLYDYLLAKQHGGKLILRIEDTDQSREVEGAVENILEVMQSMGLRHDEGPQFAPDGSITEVGQYGPYTQSHRLEIYKEHVEILLKNEHAYHCFCTPQRLDEMRSVQQKMKQPPMYDRQCLVLSEDEVRSRIASGEKYVIRMKVPRGKEVIVHDIVRSDVRFQTDTVDDQVIMKSDGFPTYHLAVVVDDYLMKITHILRGEEWLPSTPKHILLYEMFGWELPEFAHLPLLLAADGKKKLSKRDGDVSVEDFLTKGYLPEALINFIAFLGWNPGKGETQEIYTLDELIEKFNIENVHKSGAVFDTKKLGKINAHYIKQASVDVLYAKYRDHLMRAISVCAYTDSKMLAGKSDIETDIYLMRVLSVEQERLNVLSEFGGENPFFFHSVKCDVDLLAWKEASTQQTRESLEKSRAVIAGITQEGWTRENLAQILMEAAGEDRGGFLWPLRAALTGEKRSPSPMDCAWVLGPEESLVRVDQAIECLV